MPARKKRGSATVKVGGMHGELLPVRGFSRMPGRSLPNLLAHQSAWRSHDGLLVISSRDEAYLPGSGEPPLVGPQWLVSVSRMGGGDRRGNRPTMAEVERVIDSFAMPAFDIDNHHPGVAWHLWCPIDPQYRNACECKVTEVTITDGAYAWTTERDSCRGCEYETLTVGQYPCPLHPRRAPAGRVPSLPGRRGP